MALAFAAGLELSQNKFDIQLEKSNISGYSDGVKDGINACVNIFQKKYTAPGPQRYEESL